MLNRWYEKNSDRVSVLKEIAALRKDVTLLSVADDKNTFQQKIQAAIESF